jgi:hypothetical protein
MAALAAPFPPECVEWRPVGKGGANAHVELVAYLEAATVADRLDAVCGGAWSFELEPVASSRLVSCRSHAGACASMTARATGWARRRIGSRASGVRAMHSSARRSCGASRGIWRVSRMCTVNSTARARFRARCSTSCAKRGAGSAPSLARPGAPPLSKCSVMSTCSVPASRSRDRQRRPRSSPWRRPAVRASTYAASNGSPVVSRMACACSAVKQRISRCTARGAVTRSATLRGTRSRRSAARSARWTTACRCATVAGDSPSVSLAP